MATITSNDYLDFSAITILEELTVAIARKILDFQQNSAINSNGLEVITINSNENADSITIALSVRGRFRSNGSIEVENRFPTGTFTSGTGTYPFNGTNIFEAYTYLIQYQHSLEIATQTNPNADNQFCGFTIESADTVGESYSLEITVEQSDAPLLVTSLGGEQTSKGKAYIL